MPAAKAITLVPGILTAIEGVHGPKTWGAVGFCWSAKTVSVLSGPNSASFRLSSILKQEEGDANNTGLFKAGAQAHPGVIDPADAAKITIPSWYSGQS